MKFMKLGIQPDTFHTEEATRTVLSEVPSDLAIRINNITFLLHKYPLLPKCGLLQRLYSESNDSSNNTLNLDDIPGGDEAFEFCAKFCYGITVTLGAHNYASTFCAAKFLRMTEAVENGNLVMKLEAFFSSYILEGWKDPIVTLQNTGRAYEWSENLGIVRRCIESIVDKILTPPAKVAWSYTYTRPGYKNRRHAVPKDWWTEDISLLDIHIFRCTIAAIKSTNSLQPQLIGEALHVYACRWLPEITQSRPRDCSSSNPQVVEEEEEEESSDRKRKIIETIVWLIPGDKGSVSIKFLLKLLALACNLAVSPGIKAQLLRLSGLQLEEAELGDLLVLDSDSVKMVLESFLRQWSRRRSEDEDERLSLRRSVCKVGKVTDSYLQVVAKVPDMPVQKVASLAETLPGIARPNHDDLYVAIDVYLKEHPYTSKSDKKHLCRALDCQKLSPEIRAHAVKNERLPLRTVVQVLFFDRETSSLGTDSQKQMLSSPEEYVELQGNLESRANELLRKDGENKGELRPEPSLKIRSVTRQAMEKGKEIRGGAVGVGIQSSSRENASIRRAFEKSQR